MAPARPPAFAARAAMVCLALGFVRAAYAAGTYYVDAGSSSCSNTGPGTATTPYCTISAAIAAHSGPGTTILVRPGVYPETVTLPVSGAAGSPFVLRALGPVVVDGADDFSSPTRWTLVSGNVWLASGVTWSPKQVFLDGARLTSSGGAPANLAARTYRYASGAGLYVNAGGGNPGAHKLFVGRRTYGFRIPGRAWITIEGFTVTRTEDRGIYATSPCNNLTVRSDTVTFANAYGISLTGGSGIVVGACAVSDNNDNGIYLTTVTGSTIEDNECARSAKASKGAAGLYLSGSSSNVLQRNRAHDNRGDGIQLASSSNSNLLVQNRSWNNGDSGFDHSGSSGARHVGDVAYGNTREGFVFQSSSTGGSLANCVATDNGGTTEFDLSVDSGSASGLSSNDNVLWNANGRAPVRWASVAYSTVTAFTAATGQDSRSIQADPRFVSPVAGDFHLASGSPAIDDANTSVTGWPGNDADGTPRVDDPFTPNTGIGAVSYADRGAFEYRPSNLPPVVVAPATASGDENTPITFTVTASDPDGEPIASLAASGVPPGAQFQAAPGNLSGTFTWSPGFNDGRTTPYVVTFTATNAFPGSATTAITVRNVDRPPVVTAPVAVSGDENAAIAFTVTASDPDGDAIPSLSVTGLPPGAGFVTALDGKSGSFSWKPAFDAGRADPYTLVFTAANALSGSASSAITIRNVDRPPGVTAPAAAIALVGSPLAIPVTASDPDGDPLGSFDATGVPAGAAFVTDSSHAAGTLSWTPIASDVRPEPYVLSFTAANALSGSASTAITVRGTDHAPVVAAPDTVSGAEGSLLTLVVTVTDPDGDPIDSLSADLSSLPAGSGAGFTPDASGRSGTLVWTPGFDAARADPYNVTFTARNALPGSASTAFRIANTNRPPTAILGVTPASGAAPLAVTADATGSTDPDGPLASYLFDFGDGAVAGPQTDPTATHSYAVGNWTASVTVTDGDGATATAARAVSVTTVTNQAPIAALSVVAGSPYPGFVPMMTDSSLNVAVPLAPKPGYLAPTVDPTFGLPVTRITNDAGTTFTTASGAGTWGADARHHYSKDQPWSSDGTLLEVQNPNGSPTHLYLDGDTYAVRYGKCASYSYGDDRWHPSPQHPHERINASGAELMWFDVTTCTKTRSWTLPFAVDGIGEGEGNPSLDGRFVALSDGRRVFVVDMDPQPPYAPYPAARIGPAFDFSACGLAGGCALGWVSISPSGRYVVVKYDGDHPRVLDVDPGTLALTPHPVLASSPRCSGGDPAQGFLYDLGHSDMTLNPFDHDEDVLIGQEHCGNRGFMVGGQLIGGVVMVRLRDGAITPLTDPTNEAYPQHISTRNTGRPGWTYVGYSSETGKRFSDEIVAVRLDGSKAVQRFAHKHSEYSGCYRCEPHAVPSRDGRRVVWASNWVQNCSTCGAAAEIKDYVVDARIPVHGDTIGTAPLAVSVDASGSHDPDGSIVSYAFDFGDGVVTGPQPGPTASHTYGAGAWTASVTVTDDRGASASFSAAFTVAVPGPSAPQDEIHWSITGPTSVTFDWRGTASTLRYGLTGAYGQTVSGTTPSPLPFSSSGPFWEARLSGLQQNTLYHYAIGAGADHTFRTPPPRGASDFTVYVEGDIGASTSYPRVATIQSMIASDLPAFVLAVGDLTYANAKGMDAVDQHFNDVMVWSTDAAYMPVWGNHEWTSPDDLRNYKGRFDLPNPQTSPGAPSLGCCGEDWSWFDYGNVRFIAYPEPYSGAWADWSPRAAALMDEAQADPAIRFIVTFGHRPAYTSGEYTPGDPELKSILDGLGATHTKYVLNLDGHSHDYERSTPQSGVIHVTVGIGGATLEEESGACLWRGGCPPPVWIATRAMHHGMLRLRFTANAVEAHAICGPAGDSGSNQNDIVCTQGSDMDAFTIGTPPNHAPVVSAPASVPATAGQPLTVNVTAADPDGDPIDSLTADVSALPAGATFTSNTAHTSGSLTWTPSAADARTAPYVVTFTAANALSGAATTSITVTAASSATNLVGNPSFETSTSGWSANGGGTIARVAGGHSGAWCLEMHGPASISSFGVNDSPNWVTTTLGVGTRYRFKAWVRSAANLGAAKLKVREYLNSIQQGVTTYSLPVVLTPAWQMITVDYVTTVAASTLDLQVLDVEVAPGETFQTDDVSIEVVPATLAAERADARAAASDVDDAQLAGGFRAIVTPNPAIVGSELEFSITRTGVVSVELVGLDGRRVRTLVDAAVQTVGTHRVMLDGRDERGRVMPAGIYFYRITAPEGVRSGRMVFMR